MAIPPYPGNLPTPPPRNTRSILPQILSWLRRFGDACARSILPQIRRWLTRFGDACARSILPQIRRWLTRFGDACARNWWALDRSGRLFVVCLALLAIVGWFRNPGDAGSAASNTPDSHAQQGQTQDNRNETAGSAASNTPDSHAQQGQSDDNRNERDPRIAEAYEMQRRFVAHSFPGDGTFRFSGTEETNIVRNGNHFRVKGWFTNVTIIRAGRVEVYSGENRMDYLCEMSLDPELGVWHLIGRVEKVRTD